MTPSRNELQRLLLANARKAVMARSADELAADALNSRDAAEADEVRRMCSILKWRMDRLERCCKVLDALEGA